MAKAKAKAKRRCIGTFKRRVKKDGKYQMVTIRKFAKADKPKRKYKKRKYKKRSGPKPGFRKLSTLVERLEALKIERESLRKKIKRAISAL